MSLSIAALVLAQSGLVRLQDLNLSGITQDWGSARAGRSVDGNPLMIGGQTFATGVGTHAVSEAVILLQGSARSFHAMVGVDDEKRDSQGSVQFRVFVDGKLKADSGVMRGGQKAKPIDVDLRGGNVLRLVVDDAGDGIDSDHADWAEATIATEPGRTAKIEIRSVKPEPPMKIWMGWPAKPEINGPRVVGFTPGHDFIFRVPASGKRPFQYRAEGLPRGLHLDETRGVISGTVREPGTWEVKLTVSGPAGRNSRNLRIVAGRDKLALTPPMGWNSWNVWGTSVTADRVRAAADSFVKEGLADYGYNYVNIDDAWEAGRDASGEIQTNEKFGDISALSTYVHSLGLRLGIYSSPGPQTCGGYTGSWQHEFQDANTYAKWGIDYLKYDWCSYGGIEPRPDLTGLKKPYVLMHTALDQSGRDIVFSLCQYGMGDVFKWGKAVGGNLWRTTGDITDTWKSMSDIAFSHSPKAVGVSPGGWNDPDMLVVGRLGWGDNPRPTRLTPNEQITHITMWSLLAAPLIIGCDLTRLDPFTKALLTNHDVIDVDQDPLGRAATRRKKVGDTEVWARPLEDGSYAVGLINRGYENAPVRVSWSDLGLGGSQRVRDLWLRKDLGAKAGGYSARVPAHGAVFIRVGR